jgi:hypothetical protein
VHLPNTIALTLLSEAFEQSKSSSAFVEISGTEATEYGKCLYLFDFCVPLNFVFFLFCFVLFLFLFVCLFVCLFSFFFCVCVCVW